MNGLIVIWNGLSDNVSDSKMVSYYLNNVTFCKIGMFDSVVTAFDAQHLRAIVFEVFR